MSCTFVLVSSEYQRNKAQPVEKVLFGSIVSVRNITETELLKDKQNGWKIFGGAIAGGIIGNQFGDGNGRDIATILGAIIGAAVADRGHTQFREIIIRLGEFRI